MFAVYTVYTVLLTGYHCDCKGSVGEFCEFELNECSSNPCAEGSLCLDKLNGYECVCDPLKQGVHCNEVIPYCKRFNEPCKNGAQCFSCNSDTFKVGKRYLKKIRYRRNQHNSI